MKSKTNRISLFPVTLILAGLILIFAGCSFPSPAVSVPGDFTAVVWNVEALFDGYEDGSEYEEFTEKAGWTHEKYQARLLAVSQAILQIESSEAVPDLIGFVEVENQGVLDDLSGGALSKHAYNWTAFANLPGSSLGLGILSRHPIKNMVAHSITMEKETAPRPVLEVRVEPLDKPLVFFLCHWKSKLGKDTEGLRRASARVVQRRLSEIASAEPETPVIIMGDLNENHDEFYRFQALCALLPDDQDAAGIASLGRRDFLVLSGKKPPRTEFFPEEVEPLYSPWGAELSEGSYYYKGEWETIDHFLLLKALFGSSPWRFSDCRVLNQEPFTTTKGVPSAYVHRTGRGLSDHLPLMLRLKYVE
jgi:endonuclease/exonuclease/phosphatase family metal-dependent hydrolase